MNENCVALAAQLGQLLQQKRLVVSCAESCTGGGIAYAITSVSGSSNYLTESYVTYANSAKQKLLGVKAETLAAFGAVSEQTVAEMALGCLHVSQADIAIAVSGIAGPSGGSAEKPVGTVWFGFAQRVCEDDNVTTAHRCFIGERLAVREQAIEYALSEVASRLRRGSQFTC